MAEKRTRNYATVVYADSAPDNWRDILQEQFVPAFVSPYHDKDVNPNGEPKKPHWHVLIMFDSVKTVEQAKEVFAKIGGVGCELVNSLRGYARYLCHLDNPEKWSYPITDVQSLCGVDYNDVISLVTDRYKVIDEMIEFCEKYDISSFYMLSRYAFRYNDSWKRALSDNSAVFMREYLKSRVWSKEHQQDHIIDPDTGEIVL